MYRSLYLVVLFGASVAWAKPAQPGPIATLPPAKLQALAPLLRTTDVVLIESDDKGQLKQLTTVAYAAAPPEKVREVVIQPERYKDFVRNTRECTVTQEPGGTFVHQYSVSYAIYTVDGRHRYVMLPQGDTPGPAPVQMYDPDENGVRHYRWEFLPAQGGGTVVVLYGYTVVPRDGLVERFLKAAPSLEYGLALIPQLTLLLTMTRHAEDLTASAPAPPSGAPGSYEFLVQRGTLALLRRQGPRLSDMSLIVRSKARTEVIAQVAGDPTAWSQFVPTVARSTPLGLRDGVQTVEIEQSLPLISFTSGFAWRTDARATDLFALAGDLRGGRLRFDITPRAGSTELVLRSMMKYDSGSMVVRQLYKLEPTLEFGVNVGLGLVLLQAVDQRAVQLTQSRAGR